MAALRVLGTTWCSDCTRSKAFLSAHHVDFEWIDIELDEAGADEVASHNGGERIVPTIVFEDGTILVEPSDEELAGALGIVIP